MQDRACAYFDADLIAKPSLSAAFALQRTYDDALLLRAIRHKIYCDASARYKLGREGQPHDCFKQAVERVWGVGQHHDCSGVRRQTRVCETCPKLSIDEMEWVEGMIDGMPDSLQPYFD